MVAGRRVLAGFLWLLVGCEQPPATLPRADAGADRDAAPIGLQIVTTELPVARFGGVYEAHLAAQGGLPPFHWELPRGALPRGMWLQADEGAIVSPGVEEDGVFGIVLRVTDAAGAIDERALVVVVDRALGLARGALPRAYHGHPYDERVGAVGGRPPYAFALAGGSLPDGMQTSSDGRVSGQPTEDGDFSFRVAVTDAEGANAEGEVALRVLGPFAAVDRSVRDLAFCFARRTVTLPVRQSFEVARVRVAVRLSAADVSRMVLTVLSPAGTEVYLTGGGVLQGEAIDAVFGDDVEPIESLDLVTGENTAGDWTLTLYDPRCPYPARLEEVAVVLEPRDGPGESLVVEGWPRSLEAGRPSLRVAGGGLDQSTLDLRVERYAPGPNGVREGGGGDDEWLGTADAAWSTTLDAMTATVDANGHVVAGAETGAGTVSWEVEGGSGGTLPLLVLPPDWVP